MTNSPMPVWPAKSSGPSTATSPRCDPKKNPLPTPPPSPFLAQRKRRRHPHLAAKTATQPPAPQLSSPPKPLQHGNTHPLSPTTVARKSLPHKRVNLSLLMRRAQVLIARARGVRSVGSSMEARRNSFGDSDGGMPSRRLVGTE